MFVSFTGTRDGLDDWQSSQLRKWLSEHRNRIMIAAHGGCSGADIDFHKLAREVCGRSVYLAVYPSTASTRAPIPVDADYVHEGLPPLDRNKLIVDLGHHQLLAAPKEAAEITRSGTWHAVRYARKKGVPVELFFRSQHAR